MRVIAPLYSRHPFIIESSIVRECILAIVIIIGAILSLRMVYVWLHRGIFILIVILIF